MISCEQYAEEGDQAYFGAQYGCDKEAAGRPDGACACTVDTSQCRFPCGKND